MKLTTAYRRGYKKEIDYFGLKINVPESAKCVAVSEDGYVFAYNAGSGAISVSESFGFFCPDFGVESYHIGYVDLEGMDWKDTLMEIE